MAFALTGARVFDGELFLEDMAVVVSGRRVEAIVPLESAVTNYRVIDLGGGVLAPGFIDVQVNGGGGALLNDHPSVAVVQRIAEAHRRFGTTGLLPTVITDDPGVTAAAIDAVRKCRAEGINAVLGIHVEGPFLDLARKGAHDEHFIRRITAQDVASLSSAECGAVVLTVAPNRVPAAVIADLASRGVLVSLGHSDATYNEARSALDAGARAFTHLFNAMSQATGREPGMVGAALGDATSFLGIIVDGHHVHDVSVRMAFSAAGFDRMMLVTDAMPPAAGGPQRFFLQGRQVMRVNGRLQLEDGTLAGSNLTMDEAVRYCVDRLDVPLSAALQMASRNPARFLGREADLGQIAPGTLASLVHLDDSLFVKNTWVEGQ